MLRMPSPPFLTGPPRLTATVCRSSGLRQGRPRLLGELPTPAVRPGGRPVRSSIIVNKDVDMRSGVDLRLPAPLADTHSLLCVLNPLHVELALRGGEKLFHWTGLSQRHCSDDRSSSSHGGNC